jgi:hypothetical protein
MKHREQNGTRPLGTPCKPLEIIASHFLSAAHNGLVAGSSPARPTSDSEDR